MTVREVSDLAPETGAVVEEYLERLEAGLCRVRRELAADTIEETRAHFLEALDHGSTPADAAVIVAGLGEPDEYAAALCAEIAEGSVRTDAGGDTAAPGRTILGMPYEFRIPTAERVQEAWWNPADPRIVVPRVFGVGWDVNFGALAVRLHLIRPDDEEAPFASVPEGWLRAALAVPIVLTLGMVVVWLLTARVLPAELPVHWNWHGDVDRMAPPGEALGFLMVMASVPTAWAIRTFAKRSDGSRAIVAAFASLFAGLAASVFANTLLWVFTDWPGWVLELGTLVSVIIPFVVLVGLARVNRREEWKRDLKSTKGDA